MQFRSFVAVIRGCGGKRAERWSLIVVVVTVIGGCVGGIKLAQGHTREIGTWAWPLVAIGLVLMAAGIVIRRWALIVLGRFFTLMCAFSQIRQWSTGGPTSGYATLPETALLDP